MNSAGSPAQEWVERYHPLVQHALERFLAAGEWPAVEAAQRDLDRQGVDVDVASAIEEMPTRGSRLVQATVVRLPVEVLRHIEAARPLLQTLMDVVLSAHDAYLSEAEDPAVASDDPELVRRVGARAPLLLRAGQLAVQDHPNPFAGGSYTADRWEHRVNAAMARQLGGVHSLDDYMRLREAILEPPAHADPGLKVSEELDADLARARQRRTAPSEYLIETIGERNRDRLIAAIDAGVPSEGLVAAARWWQLENYLRQLLYIQLRGRFGPEWETPLQGKPLSRVGAAQALSYMASPDDAHALAHADVGLLFKLIEENWAQCAHGIGMPLEIWRGKVAEVTPIRHRIAHCRRPHVDDVERLEQLLRDLEPGANRALRAYTRWRPVRADSPDPVAAAWIGEKHHVARRLVRHGAENKGIHFDLLCARLPWAQVAELVTGSPGFFWVVQVVLVDRHLYIDDYWSQQGVQARLDCIGHVIQSSPFMIDITLPAVGEPEEIADAIGDLFESIFLAARPGPADSTRHPWRRSAVELDTRVDAQGLLSVLASLNEDDPLLIFGAR